MILIARPRILSLFGTRLQLLEGVYSSAVLECSPSSHLWRMNEFLNTSFSSLFNIISS